jgi:PrtD family type I secretion system ABC transporter
MAESPLRQAAGACRHGLLAAGGFSVGINLLTLALPLYMMQVFDRVLNSASRETLLWLSLIALAAVAAMALLDAARAGVMLRLGLWLEMALSPAIYARAMDTAVRSAPPLAAALRDLGTLRGVVGAPASLPLFDLPWVPLQIAVVFMFHWALGLSALAGAGVLGALAFANLRLTRRWAAGAANQQNAALAQAEEAGRNAEAVAAMGLLPPLVAEWSGRLMSVHGQTAVAAGRSQALTAVARFLRLGIQVGMMAEAAWLVLEHDVGPGATIAATIILGRALGPMEQAIGLWRQVSAAREAWARLEALFSADLPARGTMTLPAPSGRLEADGVTVHPAGLERPLLKRVSFALDPGEALAVVGPSGSGKSTLMRLLVGAWRPDSGVVRLDGADVWAWPRDDLGRHLGYMPQEVSLFAGSVRDNVARLGGGSDREVVEAAELAGAHDVILRLPHGYATQVGDTGRLLSGGQRQRIALARALFGRPSLVVLDEPNAHLDGEGEAALARAVATLKSRGATVVMVTHRTRLLAQADKVLVLKDGAAELFGERDEVMAALGAPPVRPMVGREAAE